MKLLSLRLRGLRSFPDPITVDFERLGEQGLFAIVGPTGAGKSTILDGIFLALFGRSPRGEASECVSPGATELVVRLEFEHGDPPRELAVERAWRWSRRRDSDDLDVRGSARHTPVRVEIREAEGFRPVDFAGQKPEAYLRREILRVSMDDFQQAVVLPQGAFDALLLARPAERRALVASLFRTEHLGQPLADVLRRREVEAKGEIDRLAEAEREIAVSEDDVRRAHDEAKSLGTRAAMVVEALERAERFVTDVRRARDRSAARDAAASALALAEDRRTTLEADRARAALARRALAATSPIDEFEAADLVAGEAEERDVEARAAAHEAVVVLRAQTRELVDARAERDRRTPELVERLGKARLAADRERPLEGQRLEARARAEALARENEALETSRASKAEAQRVFEKSEAKTRHVTAELEVTRVGEAERAEALASVAFAERAVAEARLEQAAWDERAAAAARVSEARAALEAAELSLRDAEHVAGAASVELGRCAVDDDRAAHEVALAVRALDDARTRGAAAALAETLRPGSPCPVCGARDHQPVDHGASSALLSASERALAATERAAEWTKRTLAEAAADEQARGEELRASSARAEEAAANARQAEEFLSRLDAGDEVPRGVLEARTALDRARARASLAASALLAEARERLEASVPSSEVAEARAAELAARARAADALRILVREAQTFEATARAELTVRAADVGRAEMARSLASAEADAAARAVASNEREVAVLLALAEPSGQRDLFDTHPRPTDAAGWVAHLEGEIASRRLRADVAEAALDAAREAEANLALEAREAAGRKVEASRALVRARASASAALARTGFADAAAVRAARLDLDVLEALEAELASADAAVARLRAVFEARSRDVTIEVTKADADLAETALADLRPAAARAADDAAGARERDGELARRRARSLELRARIAALAPRAERLARIRNVTAGGVLSELAAERHLEAVTRAAAELLLSISEGRYGLVRRPDGAFAVVDGAHGGLVRLPSTLSGGETFLVSLSLALALSDRIQVAGRTRFDFFFLDEGFGSLDAATLDLALGALERVRDMGRVIGMISHVPAVEERMPRRLRVVPGRPRGRARVVLET